MMWANLVVDRVDEYHQVQLTCNVSIMLKETLIRYREAANLCVCVCVFVCVCVSVFVYVCVNSVCMCENGGAYE